MRPCGPPPPRRPQGPLRRCGLPARPLMASGATVCEHPARPGPLRLRPRAHLRRTVVAERADGERHDAEEHHDRAVHRAELVVELRKDDAARCVRLAQPSADDGNRLAGIRELPPDDQDERKTDEQKYQARQRVLKADDLSGLWRRDTCGTTGFDSIECQIWPQDCSFWC